MALGGGEVDEPAVRDEVEAPSVGERELLHELARAPRLDCHLPQSRGLDLDDDLLVIAGDNLFDYPLTDLIAFAKGKGSAVAVYDVGDLELVRKYSIVELDEDDRIVGFVEKPQHPTTTLAATATYLYTREHAALIAAYLDEGNPPDQPGNYVAWLHRRAPVYGYRFAGGWYDVGDAAQLHEADTMMRRRVGLPVRGTYSLD